MDSLKKFLVQPRMLDLQVLLYLYASRIRAPLVRFYDLVYKHYPSVDKPESASSTHLQSQPDILSVEFPPTTRISHGNRSEWSSREESIFSKYQPFNYQKAINATYQRPNFLADGGKDNLKVEGKPTRGRSLVLREANASQWHDYEWRGIPEFHPVLNWYNVFSTTYLTYVIVRNVFPLERIIQYVFEPSIPARCYLMGRLAPKLTISGHIGMIAAGSHLIWRLSQFLTKFQSLPVCIFLLQSDHDVAKYGSRLNTRKYSKVYDAAPVDEVFERPVERLFRAIIAFPISYRMYKVYNKRMNRTSEARDRLRGHMVNSFTTAILSMLLLATLIGTAGTLELITDKAYVRAYPNCSPEIDKLVKSGKMDQLSVTLTWHKVLSSLWDSIESFVIWFDTGIAVFVGIPLGYLGDFDLHIYWSGLEEKLKKLFLHMKLKNEFESVHQESRNALVEVADAPVEPRNEAQPAKESSLSQTLVNQIELYHMAHTKCKDHETQVHELQAEMADFFHQLKMSDHFVSDSITMGMVVWPVSFCVYSYIAAADGSISNIGSKLFLGCIMAIVSYNSIRLCSLERRIARSYRMLCSIMAHDNSKYKHKFLPMLDFYSQKKYTYTILREYPYSLLTFLTLMGWTFSCMMIITNLASQITDFRPLVTYLEEIY